MPCRGWACHSLVLFSYDITLLVTGRMRTRLSMCHSEHHVITSSDLLLREPSYKSYRSSHRCRWGPLQPPDPLQTMFPGMA